MAGQVRVPGVAVDERPRRRDRPPSPDRRRSSSAPGSRPRAPRAVGTPRAFPVAPKQRTSTSVSRCELAGQVLDVHACAAVDLGRVLACSKPTFTTRTRYPRGSSTLSGRSPCRRQNRAASLMEAAAPAGALRPLATTTEHLTGFAARRQPSSPKRHAGPRPGRASRSCTPARSPPRCSRPARLGAARSTTRSPSSTPAWTRPRRVEGPLRADARARARPRRGAARRSPRAPSCAGTRSTRSPGCSPS